jgi:hypothetical protein
VKHRDLIDLIEYAANDVRVALIEGDKLAALAATHRINITTDKLARALYQDEARSAA